MTASSTCEASRDVYTPTRQDDVVGHVLGIADAKRTASPQEQMTLLSREQHERSAREQQQQHKDQQQQQEQQQDTPDHSLTSKPSPFAGTDSSSRNPTRAHPALQTFPRCWDQEIPWRAAEDLIRRAVHRDYRPDPYERLLRPPRGADAGERVRVRRFHAGSGWRKERGRSANMLGRFLRVVTGDQGFSLPSSATSFARSLSRSSRDLSE